MAMPTAMNRIDPQHIAATFLWGALLVTSSTAFAATPATATTKTNPATCEEAKSGIASHTGNFYQGEAHFQITDLHQSCGLLANTQLVIVRQEQVHDTAVSMDQSAAGRLHTRLFLRKYPNSVDASEALAQQVRESFTKSIVKNLSDLHFATDLNATTKADKRDAIILEVELTQIDAGNKTKRVVIGLGRGASQVAAKVTLISRRNGEELPLQQIVLNSESDKKLGALTSPLGGVSAADIAEGDVGDRKSTPQADAARMAKGLAQYLNKLTVASSGSAPSETALNVEQPQGR